MISILVLAALAGFTQPAVAGGLTGNLQSDYYIYQDAGGNDRFAFVQSFSGDLTKPLFGRNGWNVSFGGEFRDSNMPVKGYEDVRISSLILAKKIAHNKVSLRLGRFMARAGGFSSIDGLEIGLPTMKVRSTFAVGSEHYALYRTDASALPERTRAAALFEGKIHKMLKWKVDHVTRFKDGDVDDQLTTLGLRHARIHNFSWDARFGYDSNQSTLRDLMAAVTYKPSDHLQISLRYTERRYRIYQDSFFARFEVEPTKLAGLTARYHLTKSDLWLGLGVNHRIREEGDLDRIFVSLASDMGELGLRLQTGDDMEQIGGWFSAGGNFLPRLNWGVTVNFDRWESAWNAESTEEWANSLMLGYELASIADIECRVEQFRTAELDSDIRGLLTFKMRYGI